MIELLLYRKCSYCKQRGTICAECDNTGIIEERVFVESYLEILPEDKNRVNYAEEITKEKIHGESKNKTSSRLCTDSKNFNIEYD